MQSKLQIRWTIAYYSKLQIKKTIAYYYCSFQIRQTVAFCSKLSGGLSGKVLSSGGEVNKIPPLDISEFST